LGATPRHVALALVTPTHVTESPKYGSSPGYGADAPTAIVLLDVETLAVREALRGDEHLHLGFTRLCFDGDVLGVRAERDGEEVIVTLDDGGVRAETAGDFRSWMSGVLARGRTIEGLYQRWDLPMLWVGPRAVAIDAKPLAVLDLDTGERRPLLDVAGIEPVACSASGERCLAGQDGGDLFVGSRDCAVTR
jgi:hypothetical protein